MFTYVGFIQLTPEGHEQLKKTPEYLDKVRKYVEEEGGKFDRILAVMGPWDFLAIYQYPDNEAAFRAAAKIAQLEVFRTETFVAEDVELFVKAFV